MTAFPNLLDLTRRWDYCAASTAPGSSPLPASSPSEGRTSPQRIHHPPPAQISLSNAANSLKPLTKNDFAMPGIDKLILGPVYIGNALIDYIFAIASQDPDAERRRIAQAEALSKLITAISSFVFSIERFSILFTNFASGFTAFAVSTLTIVLGSLICIFEGGYQSVQLFYQINFHRDLVFRSFYNLDTNASADFVTFNKQLRKLELLLKSHSKPFEKIYGAELLSALTVELQRIKALSSEMDKKEAYKKLAYKVKQEVVSRDLQHLLRKNVLDKPVHELNTHLQRLANRLETWLAIELAQRCSTIEVKTHATSFRADNLSYHWDGIGNLVEHDQENRQTRVDDPLQVEAGAHLLQASDGGYTDALRRKIINPDGHLAADQTRYVQTARGIYRLSVLDRLSSAPFPREISGESMLTPAAPPLSSDLSDEISRAQSPTLTIPPHPALDVDPIIMDAVDEASELMLQVFIQSKKKILIHALALTCIALTAVSLLSATFLFPPGLIIGMSAASSIIGLARGLTCGGILSQRGWHFQLGKGGYLPNWICDVIGDVSRFLGLYKDSTICNQSLPIGTVLAKG